MSKSAALAAALLGAAGCTPLTTGAIDGIATGSIGLPTPMATYGDALAPPAFYDFCFRFQNLCSTSGSKDPSTLSPDAERQLQRVNASVNAAVREIPDALSEGGEDVWMPATAVGDCEDIAILKKQRLLDLGWPASSLLLTVVREPGNERGPHAPDGAHGPRRPRPRQSDRRHQAVVVHPLPLLCPPGRRRDGRLGVHRRGHDRLGGAALLKQFQEKWEPVFRPELRQAKTQFQEKWEPVPNLDSRDART